MLYDRSLVSFEVNLRAMLMLPAIFLILFLVAGALLLGLFSCFLAALVSFSTTLLLTFPATRRVGVTSTLFSIAGACVTVVALLLGHAVLAPSGDPLTSTSVLIAALLGFAWVGSGVLLLLGVITAISAILRRNVPPVAL